MSERQQPSLEQIVVQWTYLWEMSLQLWSFTPAAVAREMWGWGVRR